ADATPDILYVHDLKTEENVFINQEVTHVLGYSRDEIRAMGVGWVLQLLHPDDVPLVKEYFSRFVGLEDGVVLHNEARVRHANGSYRWMFSRDLVFSRASDGSVVEILGLATDVSERRATEEALRRANDAKDEFLAALSHELRTPLTPVLAIISSLENDARIAAEHREELGMARRNVELEARLIDDLLDLTRIVRGKLALNRESVDLRDIAEHTAASVMELREKNIDFAIEWKAEETFVSGDRSRLTQLLWNLLKNAAKFTFNGNKVRLRARNEEGSPGERPWLVIEVVDQGVGIDAQVLPKVFNAFEQGDIRITRRFGGLGLGLMISKAIVEMHGGRITAASEGVGKGAHFTVWLPTILKPAIAREPLTLEADKIVASAVDGGKRLLLV
ncbi:MAG: PAS domain S-box protein, partial [Verrucomicrobiaceae bacterium]